MLCGSALGKAAEGFGSRHPEHGTIKREQVSGEGYKRRNREIWGRDIRTSEDRPAVFELHAEAKVKAEAQKQKRSFLAVYGVQEDSGSV